MLEDDPLQVQLQRYQRILAFATSFARARNAEFDLLWRHRGAFGPKATEFVRRIELLKIRVEQGKRTLAYARGQTQQAAFKALGTFDLVALTAATKGLEALAAELKTDPVIQKAMGLALTLPEPEPRGGLLSERLGRALKRLDTPTPQRAETGSLARLMKSWLGQPSVVDVGAPAQTEATRPENAAATANGPAPIAPPPPDPSRAALRGVVEQLTQVLNTVRARLKVLAVALNVSGLPGPGRPWEVVEPELPTAGQAAGLSKTQVGWLVHLADLFLTDRLAMQAGHGAVVLGHHADTMLTEAVTLEVWMVGKPPVYTAKRLDGFPLGQMRAVILPLSHLHITFKDIRLLKDLFPPPKVVEA